MAVVATLAIRVTALLNDFEKSMASMEKKWARQGAKFQSIGRDMTTGLTLPLAAVSGLAIKAASDFESSFAGVRKTVDATEGQFAKLSAGLRKMATEIPVNVNELNKIAELGGQLGIQTDSILSFTRVIADMGVSTSLSTEEAAMGMAQFASKTQMAQGDFDRLGSTIVALGNDMATTEPKILEFANRIAGVGNQVGMSHAAIVGVAAAFARVGIEAEMGGTAVQKALQAMNSSAQSGKGLNLFGAAAGMSGGAFGELFKEKPEEAFTKFIEGVGKAGKAGDQILKGVGFDDARQIMAFMSVAGAGDTMRQSIELAVKAWRENIALAEEARKRYETFASQMIVFKNRLQDVAISAGQQLIPALQRMMPALESLIRGLATAVNWFSQLPTSVQLGTFGFLGFVAALGPASFAIGTVMKAVSGLAFVFRSIAFAPIVTGFTSIGAAIGGMGMTLLAIGGPLTAFAATMYGISKLGESDFFQRWFATSTSMEATSLRTGFKALGYIPSEKALTTAQYEAARNRATGSGMSGMISPAGAERTDPQELLARQLAEANQRMLNPNLFKDEQGDIAKQFAAQQKADEAKKKAEQAEIQRLEAIKSLHEDISGASAIAAAVQMQAAMVGVDVSKMDAEARERANTVLAKGIKLMGDDAPEAMRQFASVTMPRLEEVGDSMQNIASLAGTMSDRMRELSEPIEPIWVEALPSAEENLTNIASLTGTVTDNLRAMGEVQPPGAWDGFFDVQGLQQFADILYRLANDIGGAAGNIVGGIGGIMGGIAGYQASGGVPKGAMGKIGALANMAGAIWGSSEAGGGAGMNALSGAMSGAATGMAFGPWGAAVGAGAGALVGWAKSMMVGQDEKDAREEAISFQNELIAKFAETATAAQLAEGQGQRWRVVNIAVRDAYLAIGKSEADAMRDLERFNNATRQSAEAVQQAAGVIAQALEEQAADQERLNSAIQRYGFEWEELGAKFRQTQLNNGAKELIEDWRVLVASGISMETVNTRMAGAMNEYLQSALTVGAEVPLAMQPILQSFADQGLLVDAAGNKITDLSAAGITFTETMAAGFDRVIVKLDQLINSLIAAGTAIDPLNGGLVSQAGGGAQATPGTYRDWVMHFERLDGSASVPDMIQAMQNAAAGMPIPMAEGGIVRSPTFAMIGEAGPEAVVPLDSDGGIPGGKGFTVIVNGDIYGIDDFNDKVAQGFLAKIEQGGWYLSQARRLGMVPA
jgi:TP901 family phage tail tape measure protein